MTRSNYNSDPKLRPDGIIISHYIYIYNLSAYDLENPHKIQFSEEIY